jgi:hypothetical protein
MATKSQTWAWGTAMVLFLVMVVCGLALVMYHNDPSSSYNRNQRVHDLCDQLSSKYVIGPDGPICVRDDEVVWP